MTAASRPIPGHGNDTASAPEAGEFHAGAQADSLHDVAQRRVVAALALGHGGEPGQAGRVAAAAQQVALELGEFLQHGLAAAPCGVVALRRGPALLEAEQGVGAGDRGAGGAPRRRGVSGGGPF